MTHLFVIDIATRATRTLTSGAFTVGSFAWSPDGTSIAFDHRVNPRARPTAAPPTSRSSPSPTRRSASWSRRTVPTRTRCGRPTDRASRSRPRWPTRRTSTPTALIATVPAARRRADRAVRRPSTRIRRSSRGSPAACSSPRRRAPTRISTSWIRETKAVTKMSPADQTVNSSFSLVEGRRRRSRLCASDAKSMSEVYVVSGLSRTPQRRS